MKRRRAEARAGRFAVSPWFLALLALFAAADTQRLLLPILAAAAVHEAGHLAALRLVGGTLERFALTPFGAELRIAHSERLSYGREIAAVLAGPGINLFCALLLGRAAAAFTWEQGYLFAGIHMLLALFNLLPLRRLDGGRALYLLLSWAADPIAAARIVHALGCLTLCAALMLTAAALRAAPAQLPLWLLEGWFLSCWCAETGLVKPRLSG